MAVFLSIYFTRVPFISLLLISNAFMSSVGAEGVSFKKEYWNVGKLAVHNPVEMKYVFYDKFEWISQEIFSKLNDDNNNNKHGVCKNSVGYLFKTENMTVF